MMRSRYLWDVGQATEKYTSLVQYMLLLVCNVGHGLRHVLELN